MKEEHHTMKKAKKLEHWKIIAAYLVIYDIIAVNASYLCGLKDCVFSYKKSLFVGKSEDCSS